MGAREGDANYRVGVGEEGLRRAFGGWVGCCCCWLREGGFVAEEQDAGEVVELEGCGA